jgi:hypothetical protein
LLVRPPPSTCFLPSKQYLTEKQFARCTSDTWKHYRITLKRHAGIITFVFQCKWGDSKHPESTRERSKMKQGNSNLGETAKKCDNARVQPTAQAVVMCVLCSQFCGFRTDYS